MGNQDVHHQENLTDVFNINLGRKRELDRKHKIGADARPNSIDAGNLMKTLRWKNVYRRDLESRHPRRSSNLGAHCFELWAAYFFAKTITVNKLVKVTFFEWCLKTFQIKWAKSQNNLFVPIPTFAPCGKICLVRNSQKNFFTVMLFQNRPLGTRISRCFKFV